MARREPRVRDTKQRLLDAAFEVFAERGYRDASMEEIAARAGATKGALYYYFEDKSDLARDLQRRLWEGVASRAQAVYDDADDILTNLRRGLEAYLGALRHLGEARFFLRDCWGIPELAGSSDRETWIPVMRWYLDRGIERGELVRLDPEALARVLIGAWAEATLHILTTGDAGPTVAVLQHLIDSLRAPRVPAGRSAAARTRA